MSQASNIQSTFIQTQLRLNKAVNVQASDLALFHLYLSMAEHDVTRNPRFEQDAQDLNGMDNDQCLSAHHYRQAPLCVSSQDYVKQGVYSDLVAKQAISDLLLWRAMHPQALAQHNDAMHIDDDVINNMAIGAQHRIKALTQHATGNDNLSEAETTIPTDPTLLFDVIQASTAFSFA